MVYLSICHRKTMGHHKTSSTIYDNTLKTSRCTKNCLVFSINSDCFFIRLSYHFVGCSCFIIRVLDFTSYVNITCNLTRLDVNVNEDAYTSMQRIYALYKLFYEFDIYSAWHLACGPTVEYNTGRTCWNIYIGHSSILVHFGCRNVQLICIHFVYSLGYNFQCK